MACDMSYINTTLWGIPAEIILGDSLKTEQINRWGNLHWIRVGEEGRRRSPRLLSQFRELCKPVQKVQERNTRPELPDTGEQLGLFGLFVVWSVRRIAAAVLTRLKHRPTYSVRKQPHKYVSALRITYYSQYFMHK